MATCSPPRSASSKRESKIEERENEVNVQVIVRCRPLTAEELSTEKERVLTTDEPRREVTVSQSTTAKLIKRFTFDQAFGPDCTQEHLYNQAIAPIVEEVLKGFNCTIFAYGQTGTGKTHTMEGKMSNGRRDGRNSEGAGVIPRSIQHIFDSLEKNCVEYSVRVSFLELYNEELQDLLLDGDDKRQLRILEDPRTGIKVHNLEEIIVPDKFEIFSVLEKTSLKRKTAETLLNKYSSRSHSIFTITIHMKESTAEGEDLMKIGKLNLVDLAGSECVGRSGVVDKRAKEAGMINQSLLTLGRVINALVEHQPHVPYRDSKLTRLLQESLGGRTKTCIIATLSPSMVCLEETLSTLDYAHRAKNIRNRPEVNQKMTCRVLVKEYAQEIETLKNMLQATREKSGIVNVPVAMYSRMETDLQQRALTISNLEATLEVKIKELSDAMALFDSTAKTLESTKDVLEKTKTDLGSTVQKLGSAREELGQTKVTLKEKQVLLQARVATERELSEQASQLIGTVRLVLRDNDGLFQKIDRKKKVEEHNKASVGDFHRDLLSQFSALEESMRAHQSLQSRWMSALDARVQRFTEDKSKEILGACAQLSSVVDGLKERSLESNTTVARMKKDVENNCKAVSTMTGHFVEGSTATTQDIITSATRHITSVQQALEAQSTEAAEFVARLHEDLQLASLETDTFTRKQCVQLTGLEADVLEFVNKQRTFVEKQRLTVDERMQVHMEERSANLTAVIHAIGELLQTYEDKENQRMEFAARETKDALDSIDKENTALHQHVRTSTNQATESLQVWRDSSSLKIGSLSSSLASQLQESKKQSEKEINDLQGLRDSMSSSAAALTFSLNTHQQSLSSTIETGVAKLEEENSSYLLATDSVHRQISSLQESISTSFAAFDKSLDAHVVDVKEQMAEVAALESDRWSVHNEVLGVLRRDADDLVASKLKEDLPTGATPVKKEVPYPSQLSRTLPDDEILYAHRHNLLPIALPKPLSSEDDLNSPTGHPEESSSLSLARTPLAEIPPSVANTLPSTAPSAKEAAPVSEKLMHKPASRAAKYMDPKASSGIGKGVKKPITSES